MHLWHCRPLSGISCHHAPPLHNIRLPFLRYIDITLRWRHNGRDGVSNHQPHHCLLSHLFGRRSKKNSKLRVTGLCAGNSPGIGEFPAQMASNAENASIWWRHHVFWNHRGLDCLLLGSSQKNGYNWIWWKWNRINESANLVENPAVDLGHQWAIDHQRSDYSDVIMSTMVSQFPRRLDCLNNFWFRRRSKKTSKLRVTGLCEGNSSVTGEFPAQRASNAESVSIWWRHHGFASDCRQGSRARLFHTEYCLTTGIDRSFN